MHVIAVDLGASNGRVMKVEYGDGFQLDDQGLHVPAFHLRGKAFVGVGFLLALVGGRSADRFTVTFSSDRIQPVADTRNQTPEGAVKGF